MRNPGERRRTGPARLVFILLVAIGLIPALGVAMAYLGQMSQPGDAAEPFTDAVTYLAAGERLNAGHDLYALDPEDRPVLTISGIFSAPLLSPPPIAVLWRPLASTTVGLPLWVIASWFALITSVVFIIRTAGSVGALLAVLLAIPIGEQLAVANVNAFMPWVYIGLWRLRQRDSWGAALGVAAAIKLSPAAMGAWLAGTRRWRALVWFLVGLLVMFLIGGIGAGWPSYGSYLGTLGDNRPSPLSISSLLGVGWASYAVLGLGAGVSLALGRTHPRAAFVAALLGAVLGTPALYASGLVSLLAVLAPWSDGARLVPLRNWNTVGTEAARR